MADYIDELFPIVLSQPALACFSFFALESAVLNVTM